MSKIALSYMAIGSLSWTLHVLFLQEALLNTFEYTRHPEKQKVAQYTAPI